MVKQIFLLSMICLPLMAKQRLKVVELTHTHHLLQHADKVPTYEVYADDTFRIEYSGVKIEEFFIRYEDGSGFSIVGKSPESAFRPENLKDQSVFEIKLRTFESRGSWAGAPLTPVFEAYGYYDCSVMYIQGKKRKIAKFRLYRKPFEIIDN